MGPLIEAERKPMPHSEASRSSRPERTGLFTLLSLLPPQRQLPSDRKWPKLVASSAKLLKRDSLNFLVFRLSAVCVCVSFFHQPQWPQCLSARCRKPKRLGLLVLVPSFCALLFFPHQRTFWLPCLLRACRNPKLNENKAKLPQT